MSTDISQLKADIANLDAKLEEAKRKLATIQATEGNGAEKGEPPVAKLHGILKGRATFTEDDIQEAKIKPRNFD